MTLEDAAIPIAGRFTRIEVSLERIEAKLDLKVSAKEFAEMEIRVGALENGTNPYARTLVEQFRILQQDVAVIKLEGSKSSRDALQLANEDRQKLIALEMKLGTELAVDEALKSSKSNALRLKWVIIGVMISALTGIAGLVFGLLQVIRHP